MCVGGGVYKYKYINQCSTTVLLKNMMVFVCFVLGSFVGVL